MNKESWKNEYLGKIIEQIIEYAELNFEHRLDVLATENTDEIYSSLAASINMLGEELFDKMEKLRLTNLMLEDKTALINSITTSIPDIIFVHDKPEDSISFLNRTISDYSESETRQILLDVLKLLQKSGNDQFSCSSKSPLIIEKMDSNEIKIQFPNKKISWHKISTDLFKKDVNGEVLSTVHVMADITALKEKEIKLHKNEQLISKSLLEKSLLLHEIHHRVKNNIQIISGLVYLQGNRTSHPEVKQQFHQLQSRLQTIAAVHEGLYQNESLSGIAMKKYCAKLCQNISSIYSKKTNQITFQIDIPNGVVLSQEKATPLGLILNEAISNCFKHAFRNQENGVISIRFIKQHDRICLEIEDNGKNTTDELLKDNPKTTLGNKLIKGLASQLNGYIEINCDHGYLLRVVLPNSVAHE